MSLIILLLLVLLLSITYIIYLETYGQIDEKFNLKLNQTESYLSIGSERITKGQLLWEATYKKPLIKVMDQLRKAYINCSGNISCINPKKLIEDTDPEYRDRIDVLFINSSGIVEYTTEKNPVDLDFSKWGEFYTKITDIRMNDTFVLDRAAVRGFNVNNSWRIMGYQSSPDHKYLIQVVYRIYDDYEKERSDLSLNYLVAKIKRENPGIIDLKIIGSTGVVMDDSGKRPFQFDNETLEYATKVFHTKNDQ